MLMRSVEKPLPDAYYDMPSALTDDLVGLELFRKLVNGQRKLERMSKQVVKLRTMAKNRQSHAVTTAFMDPDTTYRMTESREHESAKAQFIKLLEEVQEEDEVEGLETIF